METIACLVSVQTNLNHSHDVIYWSCMIHPKTASWRGCASFSQVYASQILLDLLQSRFGQIHQFLQGCSPPKASPHMKKLSRNQFFNHFPWDKPFWNPFESSMGCEFHSMSLKHITLYAAFYFYSIPSIPESGKAWAATISAHFIWESFNKISRPKSFPKTVRWPTHFSQDSVMAWWRSLSASLVMFRLSPSTSV